MKTKTLLTLTALFGLTLLVAATPAEAGHKNPCQKIYIDCSGADPHCYIEPGTLFGNGQITCGFPYSITRCGIWASGGSIERIGCVF